MAINKENLRNKTGNYIYDKVTSLHTYNVLITDLC